MVPKLATGLGISRVTDDLTAKYSREGTSYDRIDMRSRLIGGSGDGSSVPNVLRVTDTSYGRDNVTRGYEYRFRIRRCVDRARTDCGGNEDWSGWSPWKVVPKLATSLSISRDTDDLTATYSREGTTYDVIDMDRRRIGTTGNGGAETGGNVNGTRFIRNDVDRGYEYRFRVRRCVDSTRLNDCGGTDDWSGWSPWKVVPKLATGLSLSRSVTTLTATYSREGRTYDVIDMVGRTIGTTGNGSAEADDDISGSRYTRQVERNDEYRFRVKRCVDSTRRDCGGDDWSDWSDWEPVPNLPSAPGTPTITVSDDDLTVSYTASDTSHDDLQFQNSDSKTSGFTNYTGGTLSGKVLSNVDRNKWYQVRVRRCTDEGLTDCIGWSQYSAAKEVPGIGVSIASRADGKSAIASYSLLAGFTYTLQLQSSAGTRGATWTTVGSSATVDSTASSRTYTGLTTGTRSYRARLSACTTARPRTCTNYDSAAVTLSKAPAPNISSLTLANQDDLTVVYTVTAWTNGTGDHYDFEIERGETATGSFSDYDDATTPSTMPHVFNNVHTGYYYKAHGRRCSDGAATICGDWSEYSSAVNVPALAVPAPTSITVSNPSQATVHAAFTPGLSSGRSVQYQIFEVGKSDTETGTFVYSGATDAGTASPVTFGELETGKWYKARGKGCLDLARKRCGRWAESSGAVEVEGIGVSIASRADGKSAVAGFNLLAGFTYTLQLQSRATTSNGNWTTVGSSASLADGATSRTYTGLTGGSTLNYRARLNACTTGTPSTCTDYDSQAITLSKAPAPDDIVITLVDDNDLTVGYSLPAWSNGSGDVLDFEIKREESSSGAFERDYTQATTPPNMPHKFNDVHTGYFYKAQGRRCSDSALTICGDWSNLSSAVNVPALSVPAPTNIRISTISHKEVEATFSRSSWSVQSIHNYVFQVGKSVTETGIFEYGRTKRVSESPISFASLQADKWYKVRGKRCYDASAKRCGRWTESVSAVETVSPNPVVTVDGSTSIIIGAGLPIAITVKATGLDRTKPYSIRFQTSTAMNAKAGVLKYGKCNAATPLLDHAVVNRAGGAGSSGNVTETFYGCHVDDGIDNDNVTVSIVVAGQAVATNRVSVSLTAVEAPTELRADGDNRGFSNSIEFDVAWKSVEDATGYQLRYGPTCSNRKRLCWASVSTWVNPVTVPNPSSSSYTVVTDPPDVFLQTLYRVELRTERNGMLSEWSDQPVYVHPSRSTTGAPIATMSFYGHQTDREYSFRLCDNSFPPLSANDHQKWVDAILAGAGSWAQALNWQMSVHGEDREFVSVVRDKSKVDALSGRDNCPEVRVEKYFHRYYPIINKRLTHRFEGHVNNPFAELRFVPRVMLEARCSAFQPRTTGCAPHATVSQTLASVVHIGNHPIPDDVDILLDETNGWMVKKGKDKQCTALEQLVAHEVGHALGVSGMHSSASGLLMSESVPYEACGPQPYDVAAMLTNYQSLR